MRNFQSILSFLALSAFFALCLTGCYRMPTDDDWSLVPTTNNPAITCEKSDGIPGLKM